MLICDAGLGAGQVMGREALELAVPRARAAGSAILALRNSHHLGRIGHWAEMCAEAGLVSVHFVNVVSEPLVAVHGGKAARLGTNPFTAGFPDPAGGDLILVDFATSTLAMGKVRVAMEQGKTVPVGALLDAAGLPTTDPAAMFGRPIGALLPFGQHKGGGLALACELLGAALVGAPVQSGPAPSTAIVNSMLSILIDPARIGTAGAYAERLAALRAWLLSENDAGGSVMLPGTPERLSRERLGREGIPLDDGTAAMLAAAEARVGLAAA
jgi:uncharacterized oxidoreductase